MDLDNIVICPKCFSYNKKVDIDYNEIAVCNNCGEILYKKIKNLNSLIFSFSFSGLIFFIVSIFYPILSLDIMGYNGQLNIINTLILLYSKGYIFLFLFTLLSVIIFPLLLMMFSIFFSTFIFFQQKKIAKQLLVIITILKNFVYLDIFFIAILVSMVKIFNYGVVELNIGFFTFLIVFIIFTYLFKFIGIYSFWDLLDV